MEPVGMLVASLVLAGFVAIPLIIIAAYFGLSKVQFKVKGMEIECEPKSLAKLLPQDQMAEMLTQYATGMASVFKVEQDVILNHYKSMNCSFQEGFLDNILREKYNMGDGDNNGIADKITGLCLTTNKILVSVLTGQADQYGKIHQHLSDTGIQIGKTAFMYEVHNAVIRHLKGYKVCMAESFVSPDDRTMQRYLSVNRKGLIRLLEQRAIYDRAFKALGIGRE